MEIARKPAQPVAVPIPNDGFPDPVESDALPLEGIAADGAEAAKDELPEDMRPANRFAESLANPIRVESSWFESTQMSRAERLAEMRAMMGHAGD